MPCNDPPLSVLQPAGGWLPAQSARLPPSRPDQWSLPLRILFALGRRAARRRTGHDEVPALFAVLARNPRLFWPWLRFAARLMPYGSLQRRHTELVILRVGWRCRCRYEWGQHVAIGLREGLSRDDIRRVADGPSSPGWRPQEQLLLLATDQLLDGHRLDADTWRALSAWLPAAQMIELTMLVGHYAMLAGLLNSLELPLDGAAEAALA